LESEPKTVTTSPFSRITPYQSLGEHTRPKAGVLSANFSILFTTAFKLYYMSCIVLIGQKLIQFLVTRRFLWGSRRLCAWVHCLAARNLSVRSGELTPPCAIPLQHELPLPRIRGKAGEPSLRLDWPESTIWLPQEFGHTCDVRWGSF
jgi:hypothetical protein